MPDHSSDLADAPTRAERRASRSSSRQPRTDWRLGGRTVQRWREWRLAVALISLGIAILIGTLLDWLWDSPWAAAAATALLWLGMLVPVVWAFVRSRPVGLLRFRAIDLLWGVALGFLLRISAGWITQAVEGSAPFPSYPLIGGRLPEFWWLTDGLAVVVVAPVIEELFFRAVILVSLYTVLRRPFGRAAAAIVSVIASTAVFVVVHSLAGSASTDQLLAITLLGLVCGALVVLTGRIWGAVLVHVVYNGTFVVLALAGTFLA